MTGAELVCLALTVYFEARSEPLRAQAAVAQVVLNRVADPRYPDTICEVVEQGSPEGDALPGHPYCQFSWRCDGKSDRPRNPRAYRHARVVALLVANGALGAGVGKATLYHAQYVRPIWASAYRVVAVVGRHIFYEA